MLVYQTSGLATMLLLEIQAARRPTPGRPKHNDKKTHNIQGNRLHSGTNLQVTFERKTTWNWYAGANHALSFSTLLQTKIIRICLIRQKNGAIPFQRVHQGLPRVESDTAFARDKNDGSLPACAQPALWW